MYVASRRVAEIEAAVNRLTGEVLLKWESQHSPGAKGIFGWLIAWQFRASNGPDLNAAVVDDSASISAGEPGKYS